MQLLLYLLKNNLSLYNKLCKAPMSMNEFLKIFQIFMPFLTYMKCFYKSMLAIELILFFWTFQKLFHRAFVERKSKSKSRKIINLIFQSQKCIFTFSRLLAVSSTTIQEKIYDCCTISLQKLY